MLQGRGYFGNKESGYLRRTHFAGWSAEVK
jgi:hypothetical protein